MLTRIWPYHMLYIGVHVWISVCQLMKKYKVDRKCNAWSLCCLHVHCTSVHTYRFGQKWGASAQSAVTNTTQSNGTSVPAPLIFFVKRRKLTEVDVNDFLIILDHGIMIRWIMSLDLSISVLCWYKKLNYDYTDDSLIYRLQPRQWHAVSIHKLKLINQPPPQKKKHTRPALFPFLDLFFSRALFFIPHLDTRLIRRTNFARTRCRLQ